jgi:membrane protein
MKEFFTKIGTYCVHLWRILWASAQAFIDNQDSLKASALTLYSLISLVPFLAVAFGIAAGFGFEEYLEQEIRSIFEEQDSVVNYAIQFARSSLQSSKGSVIAGIGLLALLWTNLSMFNSIENALNEIWHVKNPRTWSKKLTDYIAVMIICPIFFVVSSSLSVYLMTQITATAKDYVFLEWISPYLHFLLRTGPFFLSILLFMVVYLFIPNVQIRVLPRLIISILAGAAFQVWQWIYIRFQVEISNYGAVYGTLAALPLFLIWLQVSWLIVLAGAEIAAYWENEWVTRKVPEKNLCKISHKALALLVLQNCIQPFLTAAPPQTVRGVAQSLGISLLMAQKMVDILEDGGLLCEVGRQGSVEGYHPSQDPSLIRIKDVCNVVDKSIGWSVEIENSEALEQITACLKEFDQLEQSSLVNLSLYQLERQALPH